MRPGGKEKEQKTKKRPGRRPTACAECRRLKLRCDRNVPCEKCVSRGCGSICPDGELAPGKNNRMILANTEELHNQIEQLCSRNRELENALRLMQEQVSEQPHPLLRTDLLSLRTISHPGSSSGPSTSSSSKSPSTSRISPTTHPPGTVDVTFEEDSNVIDAFGTLTMDQRGESSFLGKTARPEYMIRAANKAQVHSKRSLPRLSTRVLDLSLQSQTADDTVIKEVLNLLPSFPEALHLCDVYLDHGKFMYSPIPRKELIDDILSSVYEAKSPKSPGHYHPLSLLFIVFAIATLFDTNRKPYSDETQEYYHLSKASLNLSPPIYQPTLEAIQTLIHSAQYLDLSGSESQGPDSAWTYIGHAVRLGHGIGLHLNPARWKLGDEVSARRTRMFWQLYVVDSWTSLQTGRPPTIFSASIDQPLPKESDEVTTPDGRSESNFHSWHILYTILLHSVLDVALGPKQPIYSVILDLDRKIRDFHVPVSWRMPSENELSRQLPEVYMFRWLVLSSKEITLLHLHRAHFVQALQESPADLQRHRYLPSVVAIYRSAWRLIRGLAMTWMSAPKVLIRFNLAWSHGLSAATVLCLLVTRAPTSHLTTPALEELDNLISLFDSASASCQPASDLLTSIQSLRRKAHEVIGSPHTRFYHHDGSSSITSTELDRLNGKTHLFAAEHGPSSTMPSTSSDHASRSRATSVTISDIAEYHAHPPLFHTSDNLHSTLALDLREFGIRSSITSTSFMAFYDDPSSAGTGSDPSLQPVPAPPRRETPPESIKLLLQPIQARIEPQMHYFQHTFHHEPVVEPPRMTYGVGVGSAFGGGFGAGFGVMPTIELDQTWHSFAEQLGF